MALIRGMPQSLKWIRRWRSVITIAVVCVLLFIAFSAWQSHRWIDPRFVGAWRVTNSKSKVESVYVLSADGSARWLEREGEGDQWWVRGARSAPFYWSVGRDGFLLQNLDSRSAQIGAWFQSLGGLLSKGRFTMPRAVSNAAEEIEFLTVDRIRLHHPQPGMIKPLFLTLDRIAPDEVPTPQP
jgi:hypothetical protein